MTTQVVIAGWGQVTQPKEQTEKLCDPLGLMAASAVKAGDVAGIRDSLQKLDGIMVVRPYRNLHGEVFQGRSAGDSRYLW